MFPNRFFCKFCDPARFNISFASFALNLQAVLDSMDRSGHRWKKVMFVSNCFDTFSSRVFFRNRSRTAVQVRQHGHDSPGPHRTHRQESVEAVTVAVSGVTFRP